MEDDILVWSCLGEKRFEVVGRRGEFNYRTKSALDHGWKS